jgi:hypothetical protein
LIADEDGNGAEPEVRILPIRVKTAPVRQKR